MITMTGPPLYDKASDRFARVVWSADKNAKVRQEDDGSMTVESDNEADVMIALQQVPWFAPYLKQTEREKEPCTSSGSK
ncbi:MAG: hypothetical protein ACD_13C00289G0003 [uncultured bacterium]|uniref:Uncharacterized protein n=2 Tax=Katanobacteria TaxID=422282 RepID=A0A0G1ENN9_UNCKA|nr:MAG: hypothetical protein ACD_13C00289G0003 [uncultured bacterium]KKT11438.1 MAG: hypothetical protein UV89_C0014G0007 [candidate division WWE3 bacterium GW2011_GWB2_43_22]OGC59154.1 MAG: hypothetical protein A2245_03780 [candidate division WWE3 bacterium RIFOXYA2_FULL_43_12]OGC73723.1 MAG: hypothetical protein A2473_01750 [candidate division WWE3 bacterium RIFOXYC2_FULL_42_13]HBY10298.1 hypothetical protein [candidate division WWE3 bacterium]